MVRPGLKRLRQAQAVKTDPRQTGLSQSVGRNTTNLIKKEVVTPSNTLMPNFIYTEDEKKNIALKYLLPKQIKAAGLKDSEIIIKDSIFNGKINSKGKNIFIYER